VTLTPEDGSRLVFIGGLHRSGTTPLTRLLGRHPDASSFQDTGALQDEGQHLQSVYSPSNVFGGPGRFAFDRRAHMIETDALANRANAQRLLDQWSSYWDLSKRILLEKSPPNIIKTRLLGALFPGSRIVIVVRHPVVVAMATQKWTGLSLDTLIEHWIYAHNLLRADLGAVGAIHVCHYENLVSDFANEWAALQSFLGLDPSYHANPFATSHTRVYERRWARYNRSWVISKRHLASRLKDKYQTQLETFGYSFEDLSGAGSLGRIS
jgi:hypothetical protein